MTPSLIDPEEFESMLYDAFYEYATEKVAASIEGATTIQEAAALLDCSVLFHPPIDGRNGVFGIGIDKTITLKIDPNIRIKEQWEQLRHGLTLAFMYREKPEWFSNEV